jgi:Ulp1 family protease
MHLEVKDFIVCYIYFECFFFTEINGFLSFLNTKSVPYQENGFDCGVFVCRYMDALDPQRDKKINCRHLSGERPLSDIITNSTFFTFSASEITKLRAETGKLIDNLSALYLKFKEEEMMIQDRARNTEKEMNSAFMP